MKVLLLAGGFGTRLSEVTNLIPKPMVTIGSEPILWHIMKTYSHYGFNDFVILLGYKGHIIRDYFINYFNNKSDIVVDIKNNSVAILNNRAEPWKVTLLETGLHTMTGGRILKAKEVINNETFMLTYGDGVGDINIKELVEFHKKHGKLATMTSYQPDGRFGGIAFDKDEKKVTAFMEKPAGDGGWINAGFFVCEPEVLDYIEKDDTTIWERKPLEKLAEDNQLFSYKHRGFWKPMDTLRDHKHLNKMWNENKAQWKKW